MRHFASAYTALKSLPLRATKKAPPGRRDVTRRITRENARAPSARDHAAAGAAGRARASQISPLGSSLGSLSIASLPWSTRLTDLGTPKFLAATMPANIGRGGPMEASVYGPSPAQCYARLGCPTVRSWASLAIHAGEARS
jgi:hypothetical protein